MTLATYDFAQPAKLPGDGQQSLSAWFRSALGLAVKAWAKELPIPVEAEARGVEIVRPADFAARQPEHMTAYRVSLGERELPSMLVMSRPLLAVFLAGLLGDPVTELPADRELTAVEQSLAEYFLQTLWLPFFKDTWPGPLQFPWQLAEAESPRRCGRAFGPDDTAVQFSWLLRGPFGEQECHWLFRTAGLAELLGAAEKEKVAVEPVGPRLETLVRTLPVDVVVHLGSVEVRLSQLSQLRVGDVILLNQRVGDKLTALVGEKQKFRCWAGRAGLSKAFKIDSLVDE